MDVRLVERPGTDPVGRSLQGSRAAAETGDRRTVVRAPRRVVPGISPTYDNNYYYGDLSIHLTVPEVRSIGQSYLTANLVHELTHAVQEHSRGEDYEGVGPTDPVAYALDPDEIEAHVREFVRRSKGLKVPLEKVVRDHWREFFEGDTAKARRVVREYLRRIRRER